MSEYLIQSETLTALGDKIRSITGSSEQMTPTQMVSALDNITGGLSGSKDRVEGYRDSKKTIEQVLEICPPVIMDTSEIPDSFYDYKSLSLPLVTSLPNNRFRESEIESVNLPACTLIGGYGFADCAHLVSANIPACISLESFAFQNCSALEDIYLNSDCAIDDYVFDGVLDPDNKTFRMHFTGASLSSDYGYSGGQKLFGELSSSDSSGSGSGSESGEQGISDQPVPGLEIYVSANMLDEFKTSWCGGFYANNIFAEPAVDA